MQETYRPLCSKYSLCCPNWVPPSQGTPGQGTPYQGTPPARVPPSQGTPQPGFPPPSQGTPLARVPPGWTWQGTPPAGPGRVPRQLSHGILGNVAKHYGIRVPPQVWTDKQSETITFLSYYVHGR